MSEQIFIILAIFLIVEILSQLFKLETIGKIFVQFYVVLMHLFVVVALVNYETRDMVYYFVSLVAVVNTLRYLMYKIPAFNQAGVARFFLDVTMITALGFLLINISQFVELDIPETNLTALSRLYFIVSLGLVLFYELWQKANEIGLDVRDYLPNTFFSFLLVMSMFGLMVVASYALFMNTLISQQEILYFTPFVIGGIALFMMGLTRVARDKVERYSILYVLPTLFIFILFINLFINLT